MEKIHSLFANQSLTKEQMKTITGGIGIPMNCIMKGSRSDKAGSCCSGKIKDGICQ